MNKSISEKQRAESCSPGRAHFRQTRPMSMAMAPLRVSSCFKWEGSVSSDEQQPWGSRLLWAPQPQLQAPQPAAGRGSGHIRSGQVLWQGPEGHGMTPAAGPLHHLIHEPELTLLESPLGPVLWRTGWSRSLQFQHTRFNTAGLTPCCFTSDPAPD